MRTIHKMLLLGGGATYAGIIASIIGADLIQLLPQTETSGTAATDRSPEGNNGVYNANVVLNAGTFLTGEPAPNYPANTSFCNIYSAGLNSDFNGQEFTIGIWNKLTSAEWSDGAVRTAMQLFVNTSNLIKISNLNLANRLYWEYRAGGTTKADSASVTPTTDWFLMTATCSLANDRFRFYLNGVQLGSDLTGLGTWTGSLSTTQTLIGAENQANSNPRKGLLSYSFIAKRELTQAEIAAIYAAA